MAFDADRVPEMIALAEQAGRLAQTMRATPEALGTRIKGPMDLLTEADLAVERLLREGLGRIDPAAAILGEEGGLEGDGPSTWVVDPIDGTVNFSRGSPDWAVSIGWADSAGLGAAVIHAPDLSHTAWAVRGQGSWLDGRRITFPDSAEEGPIVALGHSAQASLQGYLDRITRLQDAGVAHRRSGAATICFLEVLAGWADAFHEERLNIWDAAAGLLLIDEAGGTVHHDPLPDFLRRPSYVIACNRARAGLADLLT